MTNKKEAATRERVLAYAAEQYGTQPEYLWMTAPEDAVLRHPNGKWYGIIMKVKSEKLGLAGDFTDVLAAKCERGLQPLLLTQEGFLPAYHLNKEHWVSARLDGSASMQDVRALLDMSFELVTHPAPRRSRN